MGGGRAGEGAALRRARASDLAAVVALRLDFERITRDSGSLDCGARAGEIAALLGPDLAEGRLLCWIAEAGGGPVAQAALRLLPRGEGELMNVFTRPEFRGRGLGSALVALAVSEAASLGLSRLSLQPTDSSRRIYERAGFVARGERMVMDLAGEAAARPGAATDS